MLWFLVGEPGWLYLRQSGTAGGVVVSVGNQAHYVPRALLFWAPSINSLWGFSGLERHLLCLPLEVRISVALADERDFTLSRIEALQLCTGLSWSLNEHLCNPH